MSVMPNLTGRVCLVTGASRGIGRAIAMGLAEAGGDVAINYLSHVEEAQTLATAVEKMGRKAVIVQADVSQNADVTQMISTAEAALGPIDILVNNAGILLYRTLDELTEADFDQTISANLKSAFLCKQAVLPKMRAKGWGRIINISSGAARGSGVVGLHYNASKAGIEGLTRGYAAGLIEDGVTVNAVAPSLIETEDTPAALVAAGASSALGRLGSGEEVVQAALMVIANAYMTGQTIQVNGGRHFS